MLPCAGSTPLWFPFPDHAPVDGSSPWRNHASCLDGAGSGPSRIEAPNSDAICTELSGASSISRGPSNGSGNEVWPDIGPPATEVSSTCCGTPAATLRRTTSPDYWQEVSRALPGGGTRRTTCRTNALPATDAHDTCGPRRDVRTRGLLGARSAWAPGPRPVTGGRYYPTACFHHGYGKRRPVRDEGVRRSRGTFRARHSMSARCAATGKRELSTFGPGARR